MIIRRGVKKKGKKHVLFKRYIHFVRFYLVILFLSVIFYSFFFCARRCVVVLGFKRSFEISSSN